MPCQVRVTRVDVAKFVTGAFYSPKITAVVTSQVTGTVVPLDPSRTPWRNCSLTLNSTQTTDNRKNHHWHGHRSKVSISSIHISAYLSTDQIQVVGIVTQPTQPPRPPFRLLLAFASCNVVYHDEISPPQLRSDISMKGNKKLPL
jgi:hypothetical protein